MIIELGTIVTLPPTIPMEDFRSDWRNETEGSPHKDTLSIHLRGLPEPFIADDVFNNHNVETKPYCTDEWCEYLSEVLYTSGGAEMGRAMLVALMPQGVISMHSDEGTYCAERSRIHVPITTNGFCVNTFGNESLHMEVGKAYWCDNKMVHSAVNCGTEPRIHLIVDIKDF